ncbi:hypothetical protein N7447_002423 [Penicillium robsamsonii]|uniref:uncharacterized protein n=1 Tax=Penicillium robsamsonii TaxID=1792511 RepID=UPI002547B923|nr:uncharacterized protein N7447_002423 [Penicillium robsamsonii]KAJ5836397.1 hypothetical protein N7447_002423 [Penicillium robsamsonii]
MPSTYTVYTALSRPDLVKVLDKPDHPLNQLWPEFLDQDLTAQLFTRFLTRLSPLARFQFIAVEVELTTGNETIIGLARSIPFFWPEIDTISSVNSLPLSQNPNILNTLPDGGYDTILARGVQQCLAREGQLQEPLALTEDQQQDLAISRRKDTSNALSALSIAVLPERRKTGLAEIFIRKMKEVAVQEHLHALVVPLRPTRKCDYPHTDMSDYIYWPLSVDCSTATSPIVGQLNLISSKGPGLAFDPWLRKHLRLGGKVIKIARNSMMVRGSNVEWREWTNIDFDDMAQHGTSSQERDYVEVLIPSGLVPVQYSRKDKIGVYKEPNVWILHELGNMS